jgi:hypothetical protein
MMKSKLSIAFLSVGLILFAGHGYAARATTPSTSLAGSWQLVLLPVTPVVPPAPVHGLVTFTTDGSLVETDATEVVPIITSAATPSHGTPGHGIWQPGPVFGTYYIRFVTLIVDNNGVLKATKTVIITGTLDSTGNTFAGTYSYQVVDSAGNVIGTGSGRASADRMIHSPLP